MFISKSHFLGLFDCFQVPGCLIPAFPMSFLGFWATLDACAALESPNSQNYLETSQKGIKCLEDLWDYGLTFRKRQDRLKKEFKLINADLLMVQCIIDLWGNNATLI